MESWARGWSGDGGDESPKSKKACSETMPRRLDSTFIDRTDDMELKERVRLDARVYVLEMKSQWWFVFQTEFSCGRRKIKRSAPSLNSKI
jgi:hypothetical protein